MSQAGLSPAPNAIPTDGSFLAQALARFFQPASLLTVLPDRGRLASVPAEQNSSVLFGLAVHLGPPALFVGILATTGVSVVSVLAAFLSIALGVALGRRLALLLPGFASPDGTGSAGHSAISLALMFGALAFTVLFKARKRDAGWILLACVSGFYGARLGASVVGPELGSFVGALAVGVGSNALVAPYRSL